MTARQMFAYAKLNWPIISIVYYSDVSRLEIFKTRLFTDSICICVEFEK